MLSFRKLKFLRRLKSWGSRGQVGPRTLHVMDPEAGRGLGFESDSDTSSKKSATSGRRDHWNWTRGGGDPWEAISSQSDPIFPGPNSNPNDFRLVFLGTGNEKHGEQLRKTVSLGTVAIVAKRRDINEVGSEGLGGSKKSVEAGPSTKPVLQKSVSGKARTGRKHGSINQEEARRAAREKKGPKKLSKSGKNKKSGSGTKAELSKKSFCDPDGERGESQGESQHRKPSKSQKQLNAKVGGEGISGETAPGPSGDRDRNTTNNNNSGPALENVPLGDYVVGYQGGNAVDEENPLYLHAYFETMYCFGISPYRPKRMRQTQVNGSLAWYAHTFQLAFFSGIVFWSVLQSFLLGKLSFILFMAGKGLGHFLAFAYNMFSLLTKISSVYIFTLKKDDVDKMLESIEQYGQEYGSKSPCHCNHWKWIILGICVGTVVFSVTDTLLENGLEEWTPEIVLIEKSYDSSLGIFIWSYENMTRDEILLARKYGTTLDGPTLLLGLIGTACGFAADYQMGTIRDIVLVVVFVLFLYVMNFIRGIHNTMENIDEEVDPQGHEALQAQREKLWVQYERLKGVFAAANLVFDTLLLFLHVDNLLLYGFFASLCFEGDASGGVIYAHNAFNVVKAEVTYFIAARISAQNNVIRKWLRNWALHNDFIMVGGKKHFLSVLLDEMTTDPMEIGTGIFHIDQAFHPKFLGLVSSLVLFLADERKKLKS